MGILRLLKIGEVMSRSEIRAMICFREIDVGSSIQAQGTGEDARVEKVYPDLVPEQGRAQRLQPAPGGGHHRRSVPGNNRARALHVDCGAMLGRKRGDDSAHGRVFDRASREIDAGGSV